MKTSDKKPFLYSPPAGVWPLHSKTKHNLKIFVIFSSDRWWWKPSEKQDLPNIRTVVLLISATVFIRWWWWHFEKIRRLHSNATTDTEHFTWTRTKNYLIWQNDWMSNDQWVSEGWQCHQRVSSTSLPLFLTSVANPYKE